MTLNGKRGILGSHLNFGDPRRGWDFRSPGRGGVNFEEIIRALNQIGYDGPLSVEWEDSGMDRELGRAEAPRSSDAPISTPLRWPSIKRCNGVTHERGTHGNRRGSTGTRRR